MKRFCIKSRALGDVFIKVDDCDAYLLRSYVWSASRSHGQAINISRHLRPNEMVGLGHFLLGAASDEIAGHRNGDSLDFRRDNLFVAKTRGELVAGRANYSQPVKAEA